jgi:hypothetical protein
MVFGGTERFSIIEIPFGGIGLLGNGHWNGNEKLEFWRKKKITQRALRRRVR